MTGSKDVPTYLHLNVQKTLAKVPIFFPVMASFVKHIFANKS